MKKKFDFYYYCLYNHFYKDGFGLQERSSIRALPIEQRPVLLFSIGVTAWLILLTMGFTYLASRHIVANYRYELCVSMTYAYTVGFFYFVNSNRYLRIYAVYGQTNNAIERQTRKVLLVVLLLPVILLFAVTIITIPNHGHL